MAVAQFTPTTVDSTQLPEVAVRMLAGDYEDTKRDEGLILTQEDIINLKLYVKAALALPEKDDDVKSYIGYTGGKVGIPGLELADIKDLFLAIKGNGNKWYPIEQAVKQQSIDLDVFAQLITSTGGDIFTIIEAMPVIDRVKIKVGQANLENLANQANLAGINIPFSDDDNAIAYELKALLELIKRDIEKEKEKTATLKTAISNFRMEIANVLEPAVKGKREIIKVNNLDANIKELSDKIDKLTKEIEQLEADYDKYVGLAFTGAALGVIGIAITGGIFGSKAESARKLKNEKLADKKSLVNELGAKNAVKKAIESLDTVLVDAHIRLIDAEQAAGNLEFVWNILLGNITASLDNFEAINDSLSLTRFATVFKRIVEPWKTVKSFASAMIKLFNQAEEVYQELSKPKPPKPQ
ncbi:MAG: alpha-xenorhabdolysin family binary toxin subunit A [Snowella sp.]|nr:alpha-xenorhabdolysin family binary toxin subunit A [Snowella sp.]